MIKQKTKFLTASFSGENFEKGAKSALFQTANGGESGSISPAEKLEKLKFEKELRADAGPQVYRKETGIEKAKNEGNQDAKILAAVYEQFVSDKTLTKQEIEKLEYLDNALGGAEIAVNLKTGNASILQNDDAKTFNLEFPGKPKGTIGR